MAWDPLYGTLTLDRARSITGRAAMTEDQLEEAEVQARLILHDLDLRADVADHEQPAVERAVAYLGAEQADRAEAGLGTDGGTAHGPLVRSVTSGDVRVELAEGQAAPLDADGQLAVSTVDWRKLAVQLLAQYGLLAHLRTGRTHAGPRGPAHPVIVNDI